MQLNALEKVIIVHKQYVHQKFTALWRVSLEALVTNRN